MSGVETGNCSYAVCDGCNLAWNENQPRSNGVFSRGGNWDQDWGEHSIADIRDGTSNTIMVGEQKLGDHDNNNYKPGDVVRAQPWTGTATAYPEGGVIYDADGVAAYGVQCLTGITNHHSHGGRDWIAPMPAQTVFNTMAPPNWQYPTCQVCVGCGWMDSQGVFPARSYHPGGANHALADGSVRFISETIDGQNYCMLGNRSDGQTVQAP
jgi:hypothetical protein